MADQQDSLRIHLSLVSHTNIGKTTLARTLLMRDVGEIADRAHVTETTDDYLLARGQDGSELILWDTPGFGNSVALAKRLEGRSNPLGWFLSEVWDRFTNKSFWLDQKAVRHIRDISSVVLYLVNIAETPDKTPYIQAEMQILSWIGKPVIVLLNQMGKPQAPDIEHAQVEAWKTALKPWPFVKKVLAMDAFARCWVQEEMLFNAIGDVLPAEDEAAYKVLQSVWRRGRQAAYANSIEAMARHLQQAVSAHVSLPTPTLRERAVSVGRRLGLFRDERDVIADAQAAMASQAADSFYALTSKLIADNGLSGTGVSKEIFQRMKTDWDLAVYSVDPQSAAAVGTSIGAASGAVSGMGAAHAWNLQKKKSGAELFWSEKALTGFLLETVLLYLAVAHYGRGRGDWKESESPEFWKDAALRAIQEEKFSFEPLRTEDIDTSISTLINAIDHIIKNIFKTLYPSDEY